MGKKLVGKIKIWQVIVVLFVFFLAIMLPKYGEIEKNYPNDLSRSFEQLEKNDEYQVFVFDSSAYFPFNFARHPWFILNKKGVISRWEVRQERNK